MNLDIHADNICELFSSATNLQRACVREELAAMVKIIGQPTDTQAALVRALLTTEADFAERCAKCEAQTDANGTTAEQWTARAKAYRAFVATLV